jgi:GNAT superfamily N-acetyltransferase
MRPSVRQCKDTLLLKELHQACFPYDAHPNYTEGYWYIVGDERQPLAFAGLQHSVRWQDTGYLVRAGVLPEYRGCGIQQLLIRVRERKARALGLKWCITSTYKNTPSANNLIRCGYLLYDPTIPWGAKGTLYWKRDLHGSI